MKRTILVTSLGGILCATAVAAFSAEPSAQEITANAIRGVIQSQQEAWNRGDIDAFMKGYWESAKTIFVSGDEVTRGWQPVHDRYKEKYSDREKMGTLTFSEIEIMPLAVDAAVVLGRWELKRASDNPHGRFTLIFRKTAQGWRIVQDHTSAAEAK